MDDLCGRFGQRVALEFRMNAAFFHRGDSPRARRAGMRLPDQGRLLELAQGPSEYGNIAISLCQRHGHISGASLLVEEEKPEFSAVVDEANSARPRVVRSSPVITSLPRVDSVDRLPPAVVSAKHSWS
jgi:hypothetical protein